MRLALIALLMLVAAGCSSSESATTADPYGADDRGWLHRLDTWHRDYAEDSQDVYPAWSDLMAGGDDIERLRVAVTAYRQCEETLDEAVGRPDHERLRRAYDLLLDACADDHEYALALVESFETNENAGMPQTTATMTPTSNGSRSTESSRAAFESTGGFRHEAVS